MNEVILKVEHLSKTYKSKKRTTKAVDDISFYLKKGETLALVGESGCGKTTTGRIIVGLLKSDSGLVQFNNQQINNISKRAFRKLRSSIQIIFQDATAALNPRMSVRKLLLEAVKANGDTLADENTIVEELIKNVGLSINDLERYPGANRRPAPGRCPPSCRQFRRKYLPEAVRPFPQKRRFRSAQSSDPRFPGSWWSDPLPEKQDFGSRFPCQ